MPKTYLVTDSSLEKEGAVNMAGVELVSTEWVVQCIINEKILDPNGSPKYKPWAFVLRAQVVVDELFLKLFLFDVDVVSNVVVVVVVDVMLLILVLWMCVVFHS